MNRVRYFLLLACALLATGSTAQAQKFIFTPQWTAQAQFAGYYVAQEQGFYREVGLDVEIVHPSVSKTALNRIMDNESQATTLQLCQAMEIIDSGKPLVNILQTSMNNALVIVSREDEDPLKQKGIRVGTWSTGFDQMAIALSLREGLAYQWIPFSSGINLFLAGALDAMLAMSYNEFIQLRQAGVTISDKNVYRFYDHGYNVQEDGVYMSKDYYESHREEARKFAEASQRGWEWAAEHPDETLAIVMDYVNRNHIATNRVLQKLMLEEVLRLQVDRESGKREFRLRPDMVERANTLMLENQMILRPVPYEELIDR
jgi:NitT/TauT family transport system substrate-binding protein